MDSIEEKARNLHKEGHNCSYSLHGAFKDEIKLGDDYPAPRSIEGKCGAVLVAEQILEKEGKKELINEYENVFIKNHGSLKCKELTGNRDKCNDYIGFSAKYLKEKLKEQK